MLIVRILSSTKKDISCIGIELVLAVICIETFCYYNTTFYKYKKPKCTHNLVMSRAGGDYYSVFSSRYWIGKPNISRQ